MSPGILFLGAKEMQGLNYSMPYLLNNKHGSLYQNKIPATITLRSVVIANYVFQVQYLLYIIFSGNFAPIKNLRRPTNDTTYPWKTFLYVYGIWQFNYHLQVISLFIFRGNVFLINTENIERPTTIHHILEKHPFIFIMKNSHHSVNHREGTYWTEWIKNEDMLVY